MGKIIKFFLILLTLNSSLYAEIISIKCEKSTQVKSLEEGFVADKGYNNALGLFVTVTSDKRSITYAHLSILYVHKKDMVNENTILGLSGATGYVSESCLELILTENKENYDIRKIQNKDNYVYPIKAGVVLETSFNEDLKNYVVIYSLDEIITYSNLETVEVSKGDEVSPDKIIGNSTYDDNCDLYTVEIQEQRKIYK